MEIIKKNLMQLSLAIAFASMIGSLIFSEILKLPPCTLCWFQRIFMYPLIIIIAVGIWKKDKNLPFFVLPFSIIGTLIATYHNLLYYRIIPESSVPCTLGISCTTKQIELLGFITIPLLSLLAFIGISVLTIIHIKFTTK